MSANHCILVQILLNEKYSWSCYACYHDHWMCEGCILYKCRMWMLLWMAIDVGPLLYMIHVQFMGLILGSENMELLECWLLIVGCNQMLMSLVHEYEHNSCMHCTIHAFSDPFILFSREWIHPFTFFYKPIDTHPCINTSINDSPVLWPRRIVNPLLNAIPNKPS